MGKIKTLSEIERKRNRKEKVVGLLKSAYQDIKNEKDKVRLLERIKRFILKKEFKGMFVNDRGEDVTRKDLEEEEPVS